MLIFGDIIQEVFRCSFGFRFRPQKGTWTAHIFKKKMEPLENQMQT